jgi:hypothetical protein
VKKEGMEEQKGTPRREKRSRKMCAKIKKEN